jgi:hypothetical protein
MKKNQLVITPKTKVLQLIEAYPQLEDVLIAYVPAFKKLKNPVLRNTVARITTLQQAASIGNVHVGDLVNHLRKEVGQELFSADQDGGYKTSQPSWYNDNLIENQLDAREMLAVGEHPVNQVISDLNKLSEGKIYKLTAPFLPAPLIDKASSLQFDHWVKKEQDDLFLIFFVKSK